MNERAPSDTAELLIYGAGGHGLVVAEAARLSGWRVVGFLDDELPVRTPVGSAEVVGSGGDMSGAGGSVIVAIGSNQRRQELSEALMQRGDEVVTVVHPAAAVSGSAAVADGVFVGPQAVVNPEARIARCGIINSGAIVEHHAELETAAHVAPGAVIGARVRVGRRTLIGAGAVVLPDREVGGGAVVGAGAVVTRDVEDGETVVGNPARVRVQ